MPEDANVILNEFYDINESKELVGEWTVVGADGVIFKETLKKLPAS